MEGMAICFFGAGFWLGLMVTEGCERRDFVTKYKDEPFCLSEEIADKEYKRCWKAVEVTP